MSTGLIVALVIWALGSLIAWLFWAMRERRLRWRAIHGCGWMSGWLPTKQQALWDLDQHAVGNACTAESWSLTSEAVDRP